MTILFSSAVPMKTNNARHVCHKSTVHVCTDGVVGQGVISSVLMLTQSCTGVNTIVNQDLIIDHDHDQDQGQLYPPLLVPCR
jgi:hypothetical protein